MFWFGIVSSIMFALSFSGAVAQAYKSAKYNDDRILSIRTLGIESAVWFAAAMICFK